MRRLHSFAGLAGGLLVLFMSITGFVLSLQPMLDAATVARSGDVQSVAAIAGEVATSVPGVERLVRSASGQLVAYAQADGTRTAVIVDPASGTVVSDYQPSAFFSFMTELHRSFMLGMTGHGAAGIGALVIFGLAVSGIFLLVSKMGGWRKLFAASRGTGSQRLHTDLARIAVLGLTLTALTGTYMSAVAFELVPESSSDVFTFPPSSEGTMALPVAELEGLANVQLTDLRELVYPAAGDVADVFTLTTAQGQSFVDQTTGAVLSFTPNSVWQQVYETIYMLHTGQGAWPIALVVGLAALAVPVLALTGGLIWWARRRAAPAQIKGASWRDADTVILVGSEAGSTWGFARTLQQALVTNGHQVHLAAMNALRRSYPKAARLIVLAATYGDGAAPDSAKQFLGKLKQLRSTPAYTVLGFGDQSFAKFCGYAALVDQAMAAKGLKAMLPIYGIDRQSSGDFAAWGALLGEKLGEGLALTHVPTLPRTTRLVLDERTVYGMEVQAPVVRLRFVPPATEKTGPFGWFAPRLPQFEAGDLVGIVPPGSTMPRYYSLASGAEDGVLEICVRKQPGGLCSEYLHALMPGEAVELFVRANPDFRPSRGKRPVILIGAGAGVAPLAGFVRHNRGQRPVHLFFGARHPNSDFLYREELEEALGDGRLASLSTAFSRVMGGGYVQARIAEQAEEIRRLVQEGAQIMVCGGRDMARSVRETIDTCLVPLGMSVDALKQNGRYLEDAY